MQQIYEHDVPVETILLCTYETWLKINKCVTHTYRLSVASVVVGVVESTAYWEFCAYTSRQLLHNISDNRQLLCSSGFTGRKMRYASFCCDKHSNAKVAPACKNKHHFWPSSDYFVVWPTMSCFTDWSKRRHVSLSVIICSPLHGHPGWHRNVTRVTLRCHPGWRHGTFTKCKRNIYSTLFFYVLLFVFVFWRLTVSFY